MSRFLFVANIGFYLDATAKPMIRGRFGTYHLCGCFFQPGGRYCCRQKIPVSRREVDLNVFSPLGGL